MKLSHILIKVNDLEKAVKEWEDKGFVVEYGKKSNPYNALIYFKEGPYIELFKFKGLSGFISSCLKLFGKGDFVQKMNFWGGHEEGLMSIMLENYETNLDSEIAILKKHNLKGTLSNKVRVDILNRKLKFKVLFTDDKYFPDLMTFFTINPKPSEDIHPNGVKGVRSISLGLNTAQRQAFQEICDDDRVNLYEGCGVKDLEWIEDKFI